MTVSGLCDRQLQSQPLLTPHTSGGAAEQRAPPTRTDGLAVVRLPCACHCMRADVKATSVWNAHRASQSLPSPSRSAIVGNLGAAASLLGARLVTPLASSREHCQRPTCWGGVCRTNALLGLLPASHGLWLVLKCRGRTMQLACNDSDSCILQVLLRRHGERNHWSFK